MSKDALIQIVCIFMVFVVGGGVHARIYACTYSDTYIYTQRENMCREVCVDPFKNCTKVGIFYSSSVIMQLQMNYHK